MQTSRLLLATLIAGAGFVTAYAQNLTPADYDKLREILREKVAEERAKPAAAPEMRSLTAPKPQPQTPAPEKKAEVAPSPKPAEPKAAATPPRTAEPKPAPKETPSARAAAAPQESAPVLEQQTGPKTKQERLEALLLLYRADRLTPHEYHEQRAKVLAEP